MKKYISISILIIIALTSFAQNNSIYKVYQTKNYHNQLLLNTMTGEVRQIQDDGQSWTICIAQTAIENEAGRFCLYETQNMWTFILLDTYTGKNWQIQYSVDSEENMFSVPINRYSLAFPVMDSKWVGRFQMFETQNMWTFILLDSYNGRLWQVQYSTEDLDNILCLPINEKELVSNNKTRIFSIHPLTSMYQYYLMNDNTGDTWKFQWSTKGDDYRWIEKFLDCK